MRLEDVKRLAKAIGFGIEPLNKGYFVFLIEDRDSDFSTEVPDLQEAFDYLCDMTELISSEFFEE